MATKKEVEKWIGELGVEWEAHGVTKAQLITAAMEADDPHQYLEDLAEAQADGDDQDEIQEDGADQVDDSSADQVDQAEETAAATEASDQYARQGTGHQPICPRHNTPMRSGSTQGPLTYYYCQEPGCSHSEKVPRVNMDKFLKRQGQEILGTPKVNPRE